MPIFIERMTQTNSQNNTYKLQDKYGVPWQLMLSDPAGEQRPAIIPSLMFTGSKCGKAEEALNFYQSVFKDAQKGAVYHYPLRLWLPVKTRQR